MKDSEIEKILEAARTLQFRKEPTATAKIMKRFKELGRDFGFRVYERWLYDMVWCMEERQYPHNPEMTDSVLTRLPLVLESELNKTHCDLDGDFQKLVLSRAEVRVWITTCTDARKHIEICKDQVTRFPGTAGDQYVFAVYDRTQGQAIVEAYVASESSY